MGHYIELVIEDGAPKVRFRCDYPEDAFCRRWPLDKNVEEWFEDEPLDAGGHQCSKESGNAIVVPDGSTPFVQVPTPTE